MRKKTIRILSILLVAALVLTGSFNVMGTRMTVQAEEGGEVPPEPPVTDPPVTDPPVTDPPVTDPPVTDPPVTDPPATDPTVPPTEPTQPSESSPSETDPSETDPSETEPSETDPAETPASEREWVNPGGSNSYVAATAATGAPPLAPPAETTPAPATEPAETEPEDDTEENGNPNLDHENSIAGKYGLLEKEDASQELNLEPGVITTNVTFLGHSLSGLTASEGARLIKSVANDVLNKKILVQGVNGEIDVLLSELGIKCSDLSGVQKQLESAVPEGSVLERYMKAKDLELEPINIELKLTGADEEKILSYFTENTQDWITEAHSARVSFLSGERVVTPSTNGTSYDFTKGVAQLLSDVESLDILDCRDPYILDCGETIVQPGLTTERASTFTILGSYTTFYHAPTTAAFANREQNLVISANNMNGQRFAPGARISALTMYGDVTYENGYREAGTIMGGRHVDSVGGGICQTTTTLYNAVLYAELQIDYRSNHSMVSNYVPASRDAMVFYGGWDHSSNQYDFIFTNNTSDYIFVESFVDKSNLSITVRIIGHEDHDPGRSVEYVSEILTMTAPTVKQYIDHSLVNSDAAYAQIYRVIGDDAAEPAMTSRLWKIVYQNGVEVARYLQNPYDRYNPQSPTFAVAEGVHIYCVCDPGGGYQDLYLKYIFQH